MSEDNGLVPVRQCPTRGDAHRPLISHLITVELCGTRQSENYHKCSQCQFRGAAATEVTTRIPEAERLAAEKAAAKVVARPARPARQAEAGA